MATVFVKNNGNSKILEGISEQRANFMKNVKVSYQVVGVNHKNVVTCCHETGLLDNLYHKSGYQIDLQCFLRFLLAILKQLSICSVEQLTRLRNLN